MIVEMTFPNLRGFVSDEEVERLEQGSLYIHGVFAVVLAIGLGIIAVEHWIWYLSKVREVTNLYLRGMEAIWEILRILTRFGISLHDNYFNRPFGISQEFNGVDAENIAVIQFTHG